MLNSLFPSVNGQPQVSSASVNLTEKIATVWPAPEAKIEPNWHNKLGGALAEYLTNCGFKSSLRGGYSVSIQFPLFTKVDAMLMCITQNFM